MILKQKIFNLSDFESNFTTRQILNQKFYNLSDIKSTFLQGVRFWIEIFKTRQILSVLFSKFAKILCVE